MKILMVIDSLNSGGAQNQMVNLALGLKQKGHKVDFFLYYPQFDYYLPLILNSGINIYSYEKKSRYSLKVITALRKRIITGNYEIVLSFLRTPNYYAEVSKIGLNKIRLVVSERSMYESFSRASFQNIIEQFHRLASYITVNSHHQRKRMINFFPWMQNKICTIYNGTDLTKFTVNHKQISTGNIILLCLGSVVPHKNAANLIRALEIYHNRYTETIHVIWAGKVSSDAIAQKAYIEAEKLLDELNLKEHWQWLGERKDIPDLLHQCNALIHPSFYEGLPNAICEGLASGLPVIASRVCDHPLLVKEGWNGFLFNPNSPEEISEAIHKFASIKQDEYIQISKNARLFAEENLSLERYVDEYERLFISLLHMD
jgi:GalNAc-alpha-(1->4)-GalNAc-alpha-(1->3)-diNAcBac-PP-undecaprenol alpha-1,4-N-acetyl-D-galactosaminyltransferase